jgi:MFS-type transporter involved in bile tolerance (Atg22 family)
MGRGALVMSNIYLSTSFVYLAQEEAGCIDEEGEVIDDCDGEAFGFQPASFVSNIAVISSVLSALFMPLIGAMVDYTNHRKTVGMVASALLIAIHVIQIGTVSKTWLPMAIIQAFSGFLYQALVLVMYAYLPDMSRRVDEPTMTKCEYCIMSIS